MEKYYGLHQSYLDDRFVLKGTTATYAPDRTFDTEHIRLELKLDLNRQMLRGVCKTTIRALTSQARVMIFDAVNFKVEKVKWQGQSTPFDHKKGKLTIRFRKTFKEGEPSVIEIQYKAVKPKLGLYFLKPDKHYPKRPLQAWTQGEDEYARHWFPCHDAPSERATTEVLATVPQGFTAVSNGKLQKTSHNKKEKTSTYHWVQDIPHAPYLVTLAVGKFSVIKHKWNNIPVTYYCEKGREGDAKRAFGNTPKMLEFFSKSIGVGYPYAKYAQVAVSDFIYGGMENTSATTQTDACLLDKRAALDTTADELVAHELAHQWFGDYLTCKDWSHAWLNESFATYFDCLFKRHNLGEDEFLYYIYHNSQAYFQEDKEHYRRPIVTNIFKNPTDLFDRHLYEKGSVVLYMLHKILGEALFWKSIKTYVMNNKEKTVETIDLIRAIEEATGRNMRQFFQEWVFSQGHPVYKLQMWWESKKKEIHIRVVQTNAGQNGIPNHHVKNSFLFKTKKGEKKFSVELNKKATHFHFKLDSEPQMAMFDPDAHLLKQMDFPRPESYLRLQLVHAKNPLLRIEAAQALAKAGSEKAIVTLKESLLKDKFWGVQAEAAQALGQVQSEEAADILLHSLDGLENLKVRRAVYAALKGFKSRAVVMEVAKRHKKEKSYFAEAHGLRLLGALKHPKAEAILKDRLGGKSWNHILQIAALEGLGELKSKSLIPLFIRTTKPGVPHRVRMAAIRCLTKIGVAETAVLNHLISLTQDFFLLVQIAAVKALHEIGDARAVPALKKLTTRDWDGRLTRMAEEAIAKINKGFD